MLYYRVIQKFVMFFTYMTSRYRLLSNLLIEVNFVICKIKLIFMIDNFIFIYRNKYTLIQIPVKIHINYESNLGNKANIRERIKETRECES